MPMTEKGLTEDDAADRLVRPAERRDVPGCAQVVNDWIDATCWMPRAHSRAEIEGFIDEAFDLREIWVCGDPVEAYLAFDRDSAKIGALYCARTGAGLGKALLDRVRQGRDFVWLSTHEPNLLAQAFYRREGFTEVGRYDPEPPETVREVKMEWRA